MHGQSEQTNGAAKSNMGRNVLYDENLDWT